MTKPGAAWLITSSLDTCCGAEAIQSLPEREHAVPVAKRTAAELNPRRFFVCVSDAARPAHRPLKLDLLMLRARLYGSGGTFTCGAI